MWNWNTNVKITIADISGVVVVTQTMHNVITRGAFSLARDSILGMADLTIQQVAIGANADPVSEENTALGDERLRAIIVRREAISYDRCLTTAYVAPADANDFTINEIGWFGRDATAALGSGDLLSRVLFNHAKTNVESLQIDRLDIFSEAP